MVAKNQRVLITGGASLLGYNLAVALLAEGAEVTLMVRPDAEDKLGTLAQRVRRVTADVWDPASLRGRARDHAHVIHTVGSMVANPAQGLTYHRLNFVSARNVTNMCISDGVPNLVLISSVRAPWVNRRYIRAKREAEDYIARVGLNAQIIRAPLVYLRGQSRPLFYQMMTLLGSIPPISWLGFNRIAPMPVDILARGIARITLESQHTKTRYYAPDLRRRNSRQELRGIVPMTIPRVPNQPPRPIHPFEGLPEDTPFGWTPPSDSNR